MNVDLVVVQIIKEGNSEMTQAFSHDSWAQILRSLCQVTQILVKVLTFKMENRRGFLEKYFSYFKNNTSVLRFSHLFNE